MKTVTLFLIFGFCFIQAFAQEETVAKKEKKVQQLYFGFGAGPAFTFESDLQKNSLLLFSHLNFSCSKKTFFRGGINYALFSDNLRNYPQLTYSGDLFPTHQAVSYYLSLGKRKQLNNYFLIQATAGISYNRLRQPKNIGYKPNYGFSFANNADPFIYDEVLTAKPGFIVQAEIIGSKQPASGGIGLGIYYHYIPDATNAGFTLSLNLGKLK